MKSINLFSVLAIFFSLGSRSLLKPIQAQAQNAVIFSGELPSSVNIRSGPSTESSIVASGQEGELMTILDKTSYKSRSLSWYKVRLRAGIEGWIREDFVLVSLPFNPNLRVPCQQAVENVKKKLESIIGQRIKEKQIGPTSSFYYEREISNLEATLIPRSEDRLK